jgi:hypothetical protein
MTDDLAYRLREMADEYDSGHHESWPTIDAFNQAADELERLRELLAAAYIKLSGKNEHASDCATSNAPAMTPGRCDCD